MDYPKANYYFAWATAWGPMGAAATDAGIVRIVLPHYPMKDLMDLLAWEHKGANHTDRPFTHLAELSRDYFNAKAVDFGHVVCDLPGESTFAGKVLRACRDIPWGKTSSYSQLALALKMPDATRAVATALGKNLIPLVIPCHRITYADGRCGGFSAPGGVRLKERMLELERRLAKK